MITDSPVSSLHGLKGETSIEAPSVKVSPKVWAVLVSCSSHCILEDTLQKIHRVYRGDERLKSKSLMLSRVLASSNLEITRGANSARPKFHIFCDNDHDAVDVFVSTAGLPGCIT
jgi:hypothetical protein